MLSLKLAIFNLSFLLLAAPSFSFLCCSLFFLSQPAQPTSSWAKLAAGEGGKPLRPMCHSLLKPPGCHPSFQTLMTSFPQYKKATAPFLAFLTVSQISSCRHWKQPRWALFFHPRDSPRSWLWPLTPPSSKKGPFCPLMHRRHSIGCLAWTTPLSSFSLIVDHLPDLRWSRG
jgi:hypothetical protein